MVLLITTNYGPEFDPIVRLGRATVSYVYCGISQDFASLSYFPINITNPTLSLQRFVNVALIIK